MNGQLPKVPQTPVNVIYMVVLTLSGVAFMGVAALCGTLYFKNYADPAVLTTIVSITSSSVGAVAGILSNTRQSEFPNFITKNPRKSPSQKRLANRIKRITDLKKKT